MQRQTGNILIQQNTETAKTTGCVVGADIGGTSLRLALTNMSGTILAKWSSSTVGLRNPEVVIGHIYEGIQQMMSHAAVSGDALKSIAIGVPGITDVDRGVVIATSYLMGWRDVPLRALVEKQLNIPAAIDNDVNLAAVGESWAGAAKDVQDFIFLAIGTGIGAGLVLNGRPYRGSQWSAGEIGYILVPGTTGGPGKKGEPGALERAIGGEGIRTQWQELWQKEGSDLPKDLRATDIFDRALEGHPQAQTILQRSATLLAQAIYNISLVLNCQLFVLGGSVGMHPALCDATQKILDEWNVRGHPQLHRSILGADAQLMGAIRIALDIVSV